MQIITISSIVLAIDLAIKVIALIYIPKNRRPSSAMAWLLAIFLISGIGLVLFFAIGNNKLPKKRRKIQREIDAYYQQTIAKHPEFKKFIVPTSKLNKYEDIATLNEALGTLPTIGGNSATLLPDYYGAIDAIRKDIDVATHYVHIEYFIISADSKTKALIQSIAQAVNRGVKVRILLDHLGSFGFPGFKQTLQQLKLTGAEVQLMLPVQPLKGKYQRPDLRNHRKIVVIDGHISYGGSQNLIDRTYRKKANLRKGLKWQELVIRVEGPLAQLAYNPVFICDWFSETGVLLNRLDNPEMDISIRGSGNLHCQLLPSGPGFDNDNNLKLFSAMLYKAKNKAIITSPYFVPDEVMMSAVTAAAERGVEVVLFVSEIGDQFMVFNAQRSYYEQLLRSGVRIFAYKKPYILHSKHISIDDDLAVVGSSNMDIRSFELDLETSLVLYDKEMVDQMRSVEAMYYKNSTEITLQSWLKRPLRSKVAESLMRLTSSLQ